MRLQTSTLLEIDAVCQCSLGAIAGMMELSGVYFTTPNLEASASLVGFADEAQRLERREYVCTFVSMRFTHACSRIRFRVSLHACFQRRK